MSTAQKRTRPAIDNFLPMIFVAVILKLLRSLRYTFVCCKRDLPDFVMWDDDVNGSRCKFQESLICIFFLSVPLSCALDNKLSETHSEENMKENFNLFKRLDALFD